MYVSGESENDVRYNTYKDFKTEVADIVCNFIKSIQLEFCKYRNDEEYLRKVLFEGADKARTYASKKMELVKEKIGLRI